MSTIEVMISARDLLGNVVIPDYAEARLMEVMQSGTKHMQKYAKTHHRFKSRTGSLIDSISSEVYGLTGRVYIDDFIASYGVYVHEGQRSWAPDQFIYGAVSRMLPDLKMELHIALNEVEAEMGEEVMVIPGEIPPPVEMTPNYPPPQIPKPKPTKKIPVKVPKVPGVNVVPKIETNPLSPKPKIPPKSKEVLPKRVKPGAPLPKKKDYILEMLLLSRLLREEEDNQAEEARKLVERQGLSALRSTNI